MLRIFNNLTIFNIQPHMGFTVFWEKVLSVTYPTTLTTILLGPFSLLIDCDYSRRAHPEMMLGG